MPTMDSGLGDATVEASTPDAANPFYPQNLANTITTLSGALAAQPDAANNAANVRVGIIVNGCASNFWNEMQIGVARAANEIGCVTTFECPAGTTAAESTASQTQLVNDFVSQGVTGIALSAVDPVAIEPALMAAQAANVNVMTFDSDTMDNTVRKLYVGTVNGSAGQLAGTAMLQALGPMGGQVVTTGGFPTASNAIERIQGINQVFMGTTATVVASDYDSLDSTVARMNVMNEITMYPNLSGFVGIYSLNGPIIIDVLTQMNLLNRYHVVAFDLDPGTLAALQANNISAAIGQRPYWWGYLAVYILYSMNVLGVAPTMQLLAPNLSGPSMDIFDTGEDIVKPANYPTYRAYLNSIGITGS